MTQRLLAGALFAGVAAGILAAVLHFAFIQPVLLLGEEYESGARVHFAGLAAAAPADAGHSHAEGSAAHSHDADTTGTEAAAAGAAQEAEGHSHDAVAPGAEGDGSLTRNTLTVLFTVLIYCGYALILSAAMRVAGRFGHVPNAVQGILWGLAGFLALQGAPALGLAPEMPGTPAADLTLRQIWWLLTVLATAGGLALMALRRDALSWIAAIVVLAAPHVIGAPEPERFAGVAAPEAAALFAARSLMVGLVVWASLGAFCARSLPKSAA